MKNKGLSTVELLVVMGVFATVLASIAITSVSGIRATALSNTIAHQAATTNNALAALSSQLSTSNVDAINIQTCTDDGDDDCINKKISYKIPIIDGTPVANSMYTPDDKIKFGANVEGVGKQNCRYEYKVNSSNQLVKSILCEDDLDYCGDGTCGSGETLSNCPQDCGVCGDGTCTSVIGENLGTCIVDCRICGDSVCSPLEGCDEAFECPADCGSCSGPGGGCFLAGTPITMADGTTRPIEKIKTGDIVLSFDEETKQFKPDKVVKLLRHISDEYWIVNGHWKVTPNHIVLGKDSGWKRISQMKVGDTLLGTDGRAQTIETIFRIREKVKTYNFEVNPYHTYISGGYVVHNAAPGGDPDNKK